MDYENPVIKFWRTSPGFTLIVFGFMALYTTAFRAERADSNIIYLVVGLAFLITIAGIVLLFRSESSVQSSDANLAVGSSDIEETVIQLGKNYDILRRQAIHGFVLAGTFMAVGILVIITGSLGEMFGFTKSASNLTTIAGVVVEAVSGLGLYLFKETFRQLNSTSEKLHEMWKILAAFKKADSLSDERRADVVISLIERLVEPSKVLASPPQSTG